VDPEKVLILKEKFFGNIKFVGECYRKNILNDNVVCNILSHLCDPVEYKKNEDNLEGAVVFLTKVGYLIDAFINKNSVKDKDKVETF
jgi:hypothetical protein